jgi:hypothetical protein
MINKIFTPAAILLLALSIAFISLPSCKKDKDSQPTTNPETPSSTNNPTVTPTPTVNLKENVVAVDSTKATLNPDTNLINAGIYEFTGINGSSPGQFKVGDVIVGSQGGGYIRRITAITKQSPLTLQTTQASMEDVFRDTQFGFTLNMDDMKQRSSQTTAFTFPLNNITLYQDGPVNIELTSGSISMDPNWKFDFEFAWLNIKTFEMSSLNSNFSANFVVDVTASQSADIPERIEKLVSFKKSFIQQVGLISVPVELKFDLLVVYSASFSSSISRQLTYQHNSTFDLGMKYSGGQWQGIYQLSPNNTFSLTSTSGNAGFNVKIDVIPFVSAKFFRVAGPYASVALKEELTGKIASPSLDWDVKADVWLKSTVGADVTILGKTLANYSDSWETSKKSYATPFNLEKTSGDNQSGSSGQPLANPIKVRVVDSKGQPQSDVPVYFNVVSGGGSVNPASVLSDANGYAQCIWTMGGQVGLMNVNAKNGSGDPIPANPLAFNAGTAPPLDFTYSVTNDSLSTSAVYEGMISVNASGGTPPYTYSKGSGYGSASTFTALPGNVTYSISVKDASNVEISKSVFVPKS